MHPGELTYLTHMYVLTIKEPHLSVIRHADGSSHFYVYIYIYIYIYILHTLILWAWFLWFLAGKCRWAGHETINHNEFGGFEAKIESEA